MTLFDAGAPAPASTGVRLVVAYDGTDFHGFAEQPDQRTVAGVLVEAIEQALRAPIQQFTGAGRTDAGVHAMARSSASGSRPRATAGRPGPPSPDGQPAPRSRGRRAGGRDRRARVRRPALGVLAALSLHDRQPPGTRSVPRPLRVVGRRAPRPVAPAPGCRPLRRRARLRCVLPQGSDREHDRPAGARVALEATAADGVLEYDIRASAFCWQMVRSVVGLLVEVGAGKRRPGDVMAVIRSRDRAQASRLAPPQGLCLREVGYADPGSSR